MSAFFLYLLKSGMWIAVFWLIYRFFLRTEKFFLFNRIFLFSGLISSFIFPFLKYKYIVNVTLPVGQNVSAVSEIVNADTTLISLENILFSLYLLVVVFLFIYNLVGIIRIKKMMTEKVERKGNLKIYDVFDFSASFSFVNAIFINAKTLPAERTLILEHETAHVCQKHWVDLFLAQAICIIQWFNPFAWFYLHSIKENQEYLADQAVLKNGISPVLYKAALINNSLGGPVFNLTNSFMSNNFKRITMMKKNSSKSVKKFSTLLLIPAMGLFLWAFAQPQYDVDVVSDVDVVEILPQDSELLYILDGKEVDSIENLDPNTIESIDVFKRESATAIYGEKGKNGVIIIKTKKGEEASSDKSANPLYILDGKEINSTENLNPNTIESVNVLKIGTATAAYGEKGKNGVVVIEGEKEQSAIAKANPLCILDGKEVGLDLIENLDPNTIESIDVYKSESATALYGEKGKNGLVVITSK